MSDEFFLGGAIEPATGDRTGDLTNYDPGDLTTHGVIVGMTGSGKTGLGIIYLEEALLNGIPSLILDPKGDMTNLLLNFPDLAPDDFEPWIDPGEIRKTGSTAAELAEKTADLWKNGLASWDIDGTRLQRLADGAGFTVYTPGSGAGVPVNIVGSLNAPSGDFDANAEALRDEIQGFVSGLLGLVGVDADPISSREHILLANLIEHSWRRGASLDLGSLLGQIQRPPMRKLGVFEMDSFFPEKDRIDLAMKLNGLVASPSFASWMDGPPLDVGSLLWDEDGKPQAAIMYLAHLSEEERQFIVTLLLSKVVTWMRSQSGTGDLRALVYMDEVFGFVPPTAEPPAKKPILTMLKQARAFGVGMLLSTQNPVDLDYKAMSNAGTWCVGRLQTERDKARIVEALQSARGDTDTSSLDKAISGLGKRQFLLHNTHEKAPVIFSTRWAMSYLAGPLTREQIRRLQDGHTPTAPAAQVAPAERSEHSEAPPPQEQARPTADTGTEMADDETPLMPDIADGVEVHHMDPGASWADAIGADASSRRHVAAIAARLRLVFDDRASGLDHQEEWEAIVPTLDERFDAASALEVDYDDRDFGPAPDGVLYALPDAPLDTKTYFREAETAIKNHVYHNAAVTIFKNAEMRLYSRPGETEVAFLERCDAEGQRRADEEVAKTKDKYATRLKRIESDLRAVERRIEELSVDLDGMRQDQLMKGAGALISILTGRSSTRSVTGTARSRASARSKQQRLRTEEAKADDKVLEMEELEREFRAEMEEINDRWEDEAARIGTLEIGLEKQDIQVRDVALVWIPRT
jgi:hypothetical protein